ncbi:hypothetical protein BKK79_37165 (plasmid) [Cupriavidus sp. USMAA2-4]|uniref:hypothetical protein n=1 Tax=Cupriavidus sp. USMAA2-4 TaxID=876364 RepID=UPI0008A6BE15|nr:hypothetical protein [Cupriavidus sp. USMAA2-4]AOY97569.1 hypothetical protein BKK79_37165 [Cupriavidus sp. USMAA2-4]
MQCSCIRTEWLDPKLGFDIGFDYAANGLELPSHIRDEESELPAALFQGYRYGVERHGRSHGRSDRFTRKWLQLRVNAWRRLRHFDDRVTPGYLRTIDVVYCPITRVKLEHGTGSMDSWSVDRIYNGAGYAPGNLAVISRRANEAKGTLTVEKVVRILAGESSWELDPALGREEWRRAICLMAWSDPTIAPQVSGRLPMVVAPTPRTLLHSPYTAFQILLVHAQMNVPIARGGDPIQAVVDLVASKKARRQVVELILSLQRMARENEATMRREGRFGAVSLNALEDAWAAPGIAAHWDKLVRKTEPAAFAPALAILRGRLVANEQRFEGWALQSGGYDLPCHN